MREIRSQVRHKLAIVKPAHNGEEQDSYFGWQNGLKHEFSDGLDRLMLNNYLMGLESLGLKIDWMDEEITSRASVDADVKCLMSSTGINVYRVFLIGRRLALLSGFSDYKKLVSWAGLAPLLH